MTQPVITCKILITFTNINKAKGLDLSNLKVAHIQVNRAPKQKRRIYRSSGRINSYKSSPSHIEIILTEKAVAVKKSSDGKIDDSIKNSEDVIMSQTTTESN